MQTYLWSEVEIESLSCLFVSVTWNMVSLFPDFIDSLNITQILSEQYHFNVLKILRAL